MGLFSRITDLEALLEVLKSNIPKIISMGITILFIFALYWVILFIIRTIMLKRAKTKKERNSALMFIKLIQYILLVFAGLAILFVFTGSFTAFGVSAGLFTAALGWALQKPITGVAGWLLVMVKHPLKIGDRIAIGNVKGDVIDITLTHIYIGELGGLIGGEENSGRIVMLPNSILFEKNIINYTYSSDLILDQIGVTITYDSDLDVAISLATKATEKALGKEIMEKSDTKPYVLTYFAPSGINVYVRYKSPANNVNKYSSLVTQAIYRAFKQHDSIEFAYPHTEVLLHNKDKERLSNSAIGTRRIQKNNKH